MQFFFFGEITGMPSYMVLFMRKCDIRSVFAEINFNSSRSYKKIRKVCDVMKQENTVLLVYCSTAQQNMSKNIAVSVGHRR